MKKFLSAVLRIAGFIAMCYAAYLIVYWYMHWLSYYFVGNIKPSILIGLLTFFLSPIAAIADLVWHSFPKATVEMWIQFLIYFISGRFVFYIGEKLSDKI